MKYDFKFLQELEKKNIPESHHLEFSSGIADPRKKKEFVESVCKEISGFANADGGKIIVGVKPKRVGKMEVIDKIDQGIDPEVFGKEDLEQALLGNISPKIDLEIQVINKSTRSKNWYAVVNVPKADTAVQSVRHYRYYRRRNFKTDPMINDEIVDVMNRFKYPDLCLNFSVSHRGGHDVLDISILNIGKVISTHFGFNVYFVLGQATPKWWSPNSDQILIYKKGLRVFQYRNYLDPNKPNLFPGDDYLVTAPSVCEVHLLAKKIEISYEVFSENPRRVKKETTISVP